MTKMELSLVKELGPGQSMTPGTIIFGKMNVGQILFTTVFFATIKSPCVVY